MKFTQPTFLFEESGPPEAGRWQPPTELPDLRAVNDIAVDTETTGKNPFVDRPVGISVTWQGEGGLKDIYLPFGHSSGNLDENMVRQWAIDNFRGKRITGASFKYDIHILKGWGVDLEALGVTPGDIAFNAALLDDSPFVKLDLDTLGMTYASVGILPFPYDKDRMAELPSWMVGPYAERDTNVTYRVNQATLPLIERDGLAKVLDLEQSIVYPVCEIERNGCRIDPSMLQQWRLEVRAEYEACIMSLFQMTGMKIQPDSPDSMAVLFRHLNLAPPEFQQKKGRKRSVKWNSRSSPNSLTVVETDEPEAPKGKRKYTEEELLSLNHPVINKVVEARWLSSLLSKFLDKYHVGLIGVGGDLLRSQFHQLKTAKDDDDSDDEKSSGTVSGRFSSSGGGDLRSGFSFNAQQVIKTKLQKDTLGDRWIVRKLFTPDQGFEYFSADLSQIEYRIATHFSNAAKMINAYRDSATDFHAVAGALIQKYKHSFTDRTKIKNANFAFVFGSGPDTFAATAGIPVTEATEILNIMRREAPEFPELLKNLAFEAEHRGFVQTLYGRRARFGTFEKRYYAALNRVVQGSAADIFKVSLKAIYDERKTLGIHKLRQVVHDELNGDKEPGEMYTKRIQDFLNQQRVQLKVPVLWELKVGRNWAECH